MTQEHDLTRLVQVAAMAAMNMTQDEWDACAPIVQYEVSAAMLPIVQAVMGEIDAKPEPLGLSDWDEFLKGH